MDGSFTDFAELISQYEATEKDMIENLDRSDVDDPSPAKHARREHSDDLISQYEAMEHDMLSTLDRPGGDGYFAEAPMPLISERRRNAPILSDSDGDSDSGGESDALEDDVSQSSYNKDAGFSVASSSDEYESETKEDENEGSDTFGNDGEGGIDGSETFSVDSQNESEDEDGNEGSDTFSNGREDGIDGSETFSADSKYESDNDEDRKEGSSVFGDDGEDGNDGSDTFSSDSEYESDSKRRGNEESLSFGNDREYGNDDIDPFHNNYQSEKKENEYEGSIASSNVRGGGNNNQGNRYGINMKENGNESSFTFSNDREDESDKRDSHSSDSEYESDTKGEGNEASNDSEYESDTKGDGNEGGTVYSSDSEYDSEADENKNKGILAYSSHGKKGNNTHGSNDNVSSDYGSFASGTGGEPDELIELSNRSGPSHADSHSSTSYEDDTQGDNLSNSGTNLKPQSGRSVDSYETTNSEMHPASGRSMDSYETSNSEMQPASGRSIESYETDSDAEDGDNYNQQTKNTTSTLDSSDVQSASERSDISGSISNSDSDYDDNDKSENSEEEEEDDDDDDDDSGGGDDDSYSGDEQGNDEGNTFEDYGISELPRFNRRGDSRHSFKHPSVASGTDGESTNESGWDDSEGVSISESLSNFEDEPENKSKLPPSKTNSAKGRRSSFDNNDIESSDSDSDEFEDEPNSTNSKNRHNESDSDSEYDIDDDSDEEFLDDMIEKARNKSMKSAMSSDIADREKLVEDRENNAGARQQRFTKWFVAASVLVLIGAIILVIIYFVEPNKSPDTPETAIPVAFPTAMPTMAVPTAVPTRTVTITPTIQPSTKLPVMSPTAGPTVETTTAPTLGATAEPTPVPPNKVVVESSILAVVPNGKIDGVTAEDLEADLTDTLDVLLPQLLDEVLELENIAMSVRTRSLRSLQADKDDIQILESISVAVLEVECPEGTPVSDLCVQVTTNVPIVNSSKDFTREYASKLETIYSTAITNAFNDGSMQEVDPDITLISYAERAIGDEPTVSPTTSASSAPSTPPSQTVSETRQPLLRVTLSPTISDSEEDILSNDEVSNFTSSPIEAVSSPPTSSAIDSPTSMPIDDNIFNTSSPDQAPTPNPDDPLCTDKNDGCLDFLESGECSLTKCVAWASNNECNLNPDYMGANCKKSCGVCDGTAVPFTPTESPGQEACSDGDNRCGEWALMGECGANREYMKRNCKSSCGFCGCEDNNVACSELSPDTGDCVQTKCDLWTLEGECDTNKDYMSIFCRKSCNRCIDGPANSCKDNDNRCTGWASIGECSSNPDYMQQMCAKACGFC